MNKGEQIQFQFTASSIDEVADKIDGYLTGLKLERRNRLRIRLSMEEILLQWRDHFGEETACSLKFATRFGRPQITLEVEGDSFDPLSQEGGTEEFGGWSNRLLADLGLYPLYSYTDGKNQILLRLKKPQRNPIVSLLVAIVAAVAVGLAKAIIPETVTALLLENLITPVYDTFFGLLKMIAGPMVFTAVVWGVCGIGDVSVLGRIGKRMLLRFFGVMLMVSAFSAAMGLLMFDVNWAVNGGADATQLWSVFHMLLDMIPSNVVSPFLDGSTTQLILLAVAIGGALLVLGKQVAAVSSFMEQVNYVVKLLMETITKLIPLLVFIVVVNMFWTDSFGSVTNAWWRLVVFLIAAAIVVIAMLLYIALRTKCSPFLLVKKCAETFLIALVTSSSAAAFGTAMHCCEHKLGVSRSLTNFGLPLGRVFFVPGSVVNFVIIAFYSASVYHVEISPAWIVTAILISVILTVSIPPIPCGGIACYTVLFLQLGIPAEGLVVIVAMDIIFDRLATAINMLMVELELTRQAHSMKMLEYSILEK